MEFRLVVAYTLMALLALLVALGLAFRLFQARRQRLERRRRREEAIATRARIKTKILARSHEA